jgi:hypothetical protein
VGKSCGEVLELGGSGVGRSDRGEPCTLLARLDWHLAIVRVLPMIINRTRLTSKKRDGISNPVINSRRREEK